MKFAIIAWACALAAACTTAPDATAPAMTKVYVTRHFQKAVGADPDLTAEGRANAARLADILQGEGIRAIFVTATKRSEQSGRPLAERLGLALTVYDPMDPATLEAKVRASGGSVLVVGHSNTVPDLVERFGGGRQQPMAEDQFGTLFVIDQPSGALSRIEIRAPR